VAAVVTLIVTPVLVQLTGSRPEHGSDGLVPTTRITLMGGESSPSDGVVKLDPDQVTYLTADQIGDRLAITISPRPVNAPISVRVVAEQTGQTWSGAGVIDPRGVVRTELPRSIFAVGRYRVEVRASEAGPVATGVLEIID
jgi:hypothetical protein